MSSGPNSLPVTARLGTSTAWAIRTSQHAPPPAATAENFTRMSGGVEAAAAGVPISAARAARAPRSEPPTPHMASVLDWLARTPLTDLGV